MRFASIGIVFVLLGVVVVARSWSDSVEPPGSGSAVMPKPGDESVQKDPFAMYAAPDPWTYDQLTPVLRATSVTV